MSGFWRIWLIVWCGVTGLFGAALAAAGLDGTSGPARRLFEIIGGPERFYLDPQTHFTLAVLGAVTIGWSITLYAAIRAALALGAAGRSIWRLTTAGVLVWYAIDSTLSLATGYALNAALNTLLAAGFLLPVIASGVLDRRTGQET